MGFLPCFTGSKQVIKRSSSLRDWNQRNMDCIVIFGNRIRTISVLVLKSVFVFAIVLTELTSSGCSFWFTSENGPLLHTSSRDSLLIFTYILDSQYIQPYRHHPFQGHQDRCPYLVVLRLMLLAIILWTTFCTALRWSSIQNQNASIVKPGNLSRRGAISSSIRGQIRRIRSARKELGWLNGPILPAHLDLDKLEECLENGQLWAADGRHVMDWMGLIKGSTITFSTASGERVEINREVVIRRSLKPSMSMAWSIKGLLVPCLVYQVEHNLISVFGVYRQDWSTCMLDFVDNCQQGLKD